MSKKLYYDEGPPKLSFGVAGVFLKGVPKVVEDDAVAEALLKKGRLKELIEKAPEVKKKIERRFRQ